ncbi:protein FAR1-RELATED SEQUENCE 5-like [Vicia villosa]|uniref:protein FAR1-RELATED SEQUENCE 5-like n=1 Tax=Vicia villosa TaxID=3911 RepID=UPI00273ACB9D|nr:protein FAR1-RELATED SEQUENCE 5-like [Vicia villosa]
MTSKNIDWKPMIGMEFDSSEAAFQFWLAYGAHVGFGVRKRYVNKNKKTGSISSCRFVCCKEGLRQTDKRDAFVSNHRAETRTDCKARISIILKNEKFVIHEFIEDHNHSLQQPETTHMLASHIKITEVKAYEIDLAYNSGLRQKSTFQLMCTQEGHSSNLGYTRLDIKNYLNARRQRSMVYGDAGCLSQYFQRQLLENPSFFHAYQMDVEEQITNVFWCDANMVLDYGYFGDVVSLDTTYCTNHANRPLTIESFKWLFDTFLQAHSNKKPKTIFTDQYQAMARALAEVMPETHHGLCTWHLLQNEIKHLGNLMKGGSFFLRDFKKCMFEFDLEAYFEIAWADLVNNYNLHENNWIKSVYTIKRKWASCYMKKAFTLGMRSTQVNESLNAHFKSCMKPNVDIMQFFKHVERVVEEKRGNELSCDYESSHKLARLKYEMSPIILQMAKVHTHTVFEFFQNEFKLLLTLSISKRNESPSLSEYVITMVNHEGSWKVSFDRTSISITCSCRKFETFGILCSHALKVFEVNDVKAIPVRYILRRWTREARCGIVQDFRGKEVEGDPMLSRTRKLRQIISKFIRVATDASSYEEYLTIVGESVEVVRKKIMELRLQNRDNDTHSSENPSFLSHGLTQPKGFKKRQGLKRQKRLKGWVERQLAKKSIASSGKSHNQVSQEKALTSDLINGISCSTPPQEDLFSFTTLLMAPLNETNTTSEATEAPATAHPVATPMLTQPTTIEDPTMSSVVLSVPPVLVDPAALNQPPPVVQPAVVYDINVNIVEVIARGGNWIH